MEYKVDQIRFEMKDSLIGSVSITNNGGSRVNIPLGAMIEFLGEVWRRKEIQKLQQMPALEFVGSTRGGGTALEELIYKLNPLSSDLYQKDFQGDRGSVE